MCVPIHTHAHTQGGQRYLIPWSYHPRNLWVTQCGHWERNLRSRDQTLDPVLARRAWVNHSLRLSAVDMNSSSCTQKGPSLPLSGISRVQPPAAEQNHRVVVGVHPGDPKQNSGALELPQLASYSQRSLGKEEKIGIPYALCLDASHPPGGVSCWGTGYLDYIHTSPALDLLLQAISVSLLISLWMDLELHPLSF